MAHDQATVESARPAGETFGHLATFSNAVSWDPGVLAGEQLDPGPVGTGTRFRLVVPFLGLRMPLTYEAEVRLRGPLRVLDPVLRPGFRAVAERAAGRAGTCPVRGPL
jgi:hypothetical protein